MTIRTELANDLTRAIARAQELHHPHDADVFRTMRQLLNSPLAPEPYQRTTARGGHMLDQVTHYALLTVEHRLGYRPMSLDVLQGSYTSDNPASGGTHDGGGAVDLSPTEHQAKVHALRSVGFAAWHRPKLVRNGKVVWNEHVHAVLIGNAKLSPAAQAQVADYRAHRDGLVSNLPDPTWHPDPIPIFHMPIYRMEV